MNEILMFSNSQFGEIRITMSETQHPLFCLTDVCNALEISNVGNCKSRLTPKGIRSMDTPTKGGIQSMTYINEANLYKCIFQSRKPEAEKFQDWVCEEVLPSIRKHGAYMSEQVIERTLSDPDYLIQLATTLKEEKQKRIDAEQQLQIAQGENTHLQEQNRMLAPKAQYTDDVLQSTSTYTLTQIAHDLGMRSVYALTEWLFKHKILYRQSGQIQPTAKVADKGYFTTRTARYFKSDGTVATSISTVVTESGRQWLHAKAQTRT